MIEYNKKEVVSSQKVNVLVEIEDFLRFIHAHPKTKLTDTYKALKLSGRRGNALRNKAKENQLVEEVVHQTGGKGRPYKELKLTQKGREYIHEK